jgi:hypothetical protein
LRTSTQRGSLPEHCETVAPRTPRACVQRRQVPGAPPHARWGKRTVEEMEGKKKTYMHDMEQRGRRRRSRGTQDVCVSRGRSGPREFGGWQAHGAEGEVWKSRLAAMVTLVVMMCAHVCVGAVRGIKVCADAGMPATVRCGAVRAWAWGAWAARVTEIATAAALQGWLQVRLAWDVCAEEKTRELEKYDAPKSKYGWPGAYGGCARSRQ